MWQRSPKTRTTNDFLNRAPGDIADGTVPEAPQDNLGAYTLQAGDTLERVALQVYGDSSLWYLLADANGITDRNAQAGNNGQLHIGQRINIPPAATGQHQTNGTHKVLNANQMIGNTSATTANPVPPAPPPLPKNHNGFFSKIVVAIIAVVATVMTAGIIGALAGVAQAGADLFATGMNVLGGGVMATTTGTLAAGFTAGFVSSIASQGAAKALGLQEGVDLKNALVQGLATAATGGLLRGLNSSTAYNGLVESVDHLSISKTFSISNAAQLMEQNALSQGINLSLTKHQHFDWEQLAIAGATAGLMGGTMGKQLDQTLRTVDHNTGILISELKSLINAGTETATTGSHFDATQVLSDNLGSAIGSSLVDSGKNIEQQETLGEEFITGDKLYLTENVLDMIHSEPTDNTVYRNYIARQLSGSGGYGEIYAELKSDFELIKAGSTSEENIVSTKTFIWKDEEYDSLYGSNLQGFIGNIRNKDAFMVTNGKGVFAYDIKNTSIKPPLANLTNSISLNTEINREQLAILLMSEASIGNYAEKIAVGNTVLNRMYRNNTTKVADVWRAYGRNQTPTSEMTDLAGDILSGNILDNTGGATHYYSPRSMPKKGRSTVGFDVGGGLEHVEGLSFKNYRPTFANSFKYVNIPDVREGYYKFYIAPGTGKVK
jgi:outer membrane lipoprotein-sorting protein